MINSSFNLYNEQCRNLIFNGREFLITEVGTSEENKKKLGVNCNGFGRVRQFKRFKDADWISNPLPFDPYSTTMGRGHVDELAVQVFQIAKCNLNCWWCFLPDEYKKCNAQHTKWFSVGNLIDLYIRDTNKAVPVIDISGGNPELVPEFTLSFMQELEKHNLSEKVYLWSDDVLTTDYLFTKLSESQIQYMSDYKGFGKVACFKGIDDESYCFNTCSAKSELNSQFLMAKKYVNAGFDIYFYIALTVPNLQDINRKISFFFDNLQNISYYLPLRVVPIKIKNYPTNKHRISQIRNISISNQFIALSIWMEEISKRYNSIEIDKNISMHVLG